MAAPHKTRTQTLNGILWELWMIDLKTSLSPLISAFVVAIDDFSQAALSIFDLSIQIDADWRDPFTLNIRLSNITVTLLRSKPLWVTKLVHRSYEVDQVESSCLLLDFLQDLVSGDIHQIEPMVYRASMVFPRWTHGNEDCQFAKCFGCSDIEDS